MTVRSFIASIGKRSGNLRPGPTWSVPSVSPVPKDDIALGRKHAHPRRLMDQPPEKLSVPELRTVLRQLLSSERYHHALHLAKSLEARDGYRMSASDHALRVELTCKAGSLPEAEAYYDLIPDSASRKAASLSLLRGYVKSREVEKAEALFKHLNTCGLAVSPHPFNELMKAYMSSSQCDRVLVLVARMKRDRIPRNVMSYNIWIRASGRVDGVEGAEWVFREMVRDENMEVGWSSLVTLANVYVDAGLREKASCVLGEAERKLSTGKRLGFFFVMTLYSSLGDKEGVMRMWEASKGVRGRITCGNYMSVLSCLVKLGEVVEAERVFMEWEAGCRRYDVRVSNVMLGAYVRNRLMRKAELLHMRVMERGGRPNYKTWEIMMEGWVKCGKMEKAVDAMRRGFSMLKDCEWRPSHDLLMLVLEYFDKQKKLDDAVEFLTAVHQMGLASSPLYRILLRMHLSAGKSAEYIMKMMEKDGIVVGNEISSMIMALDKQCKTIDARR